MAARALELGRPSGVDGALLAIAALAAATSGPLSAAIAAPALAISFWRCALAALVTAPFAWRARSTAACSARDRRLMALSGVLLAGHFATWITGVRLTSVAAATALVATQPVWAVLIARRAGVRTTPTTWAGIVVAVAGILLVTGVDVAGGARAITGDLLALLGGVLAAAYVSVGERVRQRVPASPYNAFVFGTAALVLLVCALVGRQPLVGYSAYDWVLLLALTGGAQLLGHSLVNRVVRTTSATVVSLALLFEVPGAALIAGLWLGQTPTPLLLPAIALLVLGLFLVIRSGTRRTPTESPPL